MTGRKREAAPVLSTYDTHNAGVAGLMDRAVATRDPELVALIMWLVS